MIKYIGSRDNKNIKLVRSLSKRKYREKHLLFVAEGSRIAAEAVQYGKVKFLVVSEDYYSKNEKSLNSNNVNINIVNDKVFAEICDTDNSQGILAVLEIPIEKQEEPGNGLVLILDGISEPGNIGTIIRTADAMGVSAVYLINDCVDIYNPKSVRATMGSVFRVNVVRRDPDELFDKLKTAGFSIYATTPDSVVDIKDAKKTDRCALIIGSEASGVSEKALEYADIRVKIPMDGMAESLNAAVAAGIVMYEMTCNR